MRTKYWVTRPSRNEIGALRRELLERGFAVVSTPRFFDDALHRRLGIGCPTTLLAGCDRWRKFPQLERYARWLEHLLDTALPDEGLSLKALEYRHEPEGFENEQVDGLHADGSYLRTVFTAYGKATIYRDGKTERPVPAGHTLLMTAQGRTRLVGVPCTLHRRPGPGPERAVIVCTFEPQPANGAHVP